MKEISAQEISRTIALLAREAALYLGEDVIAALRSAADNEKSPLGREILLKIIENAGIARQEGIPLCQDCGFAVVFAEIGQDVRVSGGSFEEAIHEGVRIGYREGFLRKSIVARPFSQRINTGDNTPAVIHTRMVPGERIHIWFAPKGGGSENMSRFAVLKPAQGRQGIIDFVVKAVDEAGSNPCPPVIVGVGIGGTAEISMELAKRSLLRTVGEPNEDSETAELERDLMECINNLGIGPQGVGGTTTALAVNIETYPCHIASLPVAVNLQCHSARHKEAVL
jgi:fumarate hydratase subunit alpha